MLAGSVRSEEDGTMPISAVDSAVFDLHDLCGQALTFTGIPALKNISVTEHQERVILTGKVTSYYLKQLAQEAVIPHLGQRRLVNRIMVVHH
jgi:hypothetical protein